jgi:polysaccharide export outer membrane protein
MDMKSRLKLALIILAVLVAGAASAVAADQAKPKTQQNTRVEAAAQPQPGPVEYVIGPDDLLAVNVWKEPEISRNVPVRPDGKISLPLVGDLRADGRTPAQLQDEIRQKLLAYLSDPEVSVIVQEARSQKFNILGEIERPGSYVLSHSMTVLDAIAVAGGFKDFARTSKIYVLRVHGDGSRACIPFNYKEVIKGRNLSQNVELEARDTIVVP